MGTVVAASLSTGASSEMASKLTAAHHARTNNRWEDGERVEQTLETFDRWLIHSAEEVTVELAGTRVALHQKVCARY